MHYERMERAAQQRAEHERAAKAVMPPSGDGSTDASSHPLDEHSLFIGTGYTGQPTQSRGPHWNGDAAREPVRVKALERPAAHSTYRPLVDVWTGEITS